MKPGVGLPIGDDGGTPEAVKNLAQAADAIGCRGIAAPNQVPRADVANRPGLTGGRRPFEEPPLMRAVWPVAVLAVPLCLGGASIARAEGNSTWLLTAFETVCLARPDSIAALDALATGRGFVRRPFDASRPLPEKPEDEFNWLTTWRLGEGKSRLELTAITAGTADRYVFSCLMNIPDVAPDELIAGVKRWPGLEGPRMEREKEDHATLTWTLTGDPRQATVAVFYDPTKGRQMVGLDLDRIFAKSGGK